MAASAAQILLAVLLLVAVAGCAGGRGRTFADKRPPDQSGRARLAEAEPPREAGRLRDRDESSYRAGGGGRSVVAAPRSSPARVSPVSLSSNIGGADPIAITPQNFEEAVLNSPVPVLVDCWAPWCGPCKRMSPVVDELANEFEGRAVVAKLDIDACPQIKARYGVTNIPAFLYFQNGELVDRVVGAVPKSQLGKKLAALSAQVQPVGGELPPSDESGE